MLFKLNKNMQIFLNELGEWKEVSIIACFPKKDPKSFLSVVNKEGEEVAFIKSLSELDEMAQKTIHDYLKFKLFQFEVIGIYNVEEDFGVRHFEVKTTSGKRSFQTELDQWPEKSETCGYELKDIYGDRYYFNLLQFGEDKIANLVN